MLCSIRLSLKEFELYFILTNLHSPWDSTRSIINRIDVPYKMKASHDDIQFTVSCISWFHFMPVNVLNLLPCLTFCWPQLHFPSLGIYYMICPGPFLSFNSNRDISHPCLLFDLLWSPNSLRVNVVYVHHCMCVWKMHHTFSLYFFFSFFKEKLWSLSSSHTEHP